MMTRKMFWQGASNWGFLGGAALFAVNLIGWGLKLEQSASWAYELLMFVVLLSLILYTGKRNAALSGPEGYSYGRAFGFVLAMMLFAGIVYGVGKFLLVNFLAPGYYLALNSEAIDASLAMMKGSPQYQMIIEMRPQMLGWLANPFYLIFGAIVELVFKGGFLGLVLCAFVTRKPDLFAAQNEPEA